jgi:glycosyltransferase involved in cell wall biosynthesis
MHAGTVRLAFRDDEREVPIWKATHPSSFGLSKPSVLFVHTNFPGQFGFLAEELNARGHRCAAIGSQTARGVPGICLLRWQPGKGSTAGIDAAAVRAEADLIRARAAARCALELRRSGFEPDVVIGHPGWGETLFLKEVFPKARFILYGEFFYRSEGVDVGFDPEFGEPSDDERFGVHAKNAGLALAYTAADVIVCPTDFQAGLFPGLFRPLIRTIHEGVDLDRIRPDPEARFRLPDGRLLDRTTPVVTFVNRHFEPLRGFHVFMRALPAFLCAVPKAQVLMIGSDAKRGYGSAAGRGESWKDRMLREVGERIDMGRVHFTGRLPHEDLLAAYSVSAAHVGFTYPFALSWSTLEAMACECLVLGSNTAPVSAVIEDGKNGRLLDFFDVAGLAAELEHACRMPEKLAPLRRAARETIRLRYSQRDEAIPRWIGLVDEMCP